MSKKTECGFCDNGKPLDTPKDWDESWGRLFPGSETPKTCRYCGGEEPNA